MPCISSVRSLYYYYYYYYYYCYYYYHGHFQIVRVFKWSSTPDFLCNYKRRNSTAYVKYDCFLHSNVHIRANIEQSQAVSSTYRTTQTVCSCKIYITYSIRLEYFCSFSLTVLWSFVTAGSCCMHWICFFDSFVKHNYIWFVVTDIPITRYGPLLLLLLLLLLYIIIIIITVYYYYYYFLLLRVKMWTILA
jgi:hypothetical protein